MSIKAIFPAGETAITVNGLHQWDYGQTLEIHADDLPALIEVHFSCPGMQDAIVRVGSGVSGVATVSIPDLCLEQSLPIIAWVYEIGSTSGQTIKTITLTVQARTRPQTTEFFNSGDDDYSYADVVAEMNEAVGSIRDGDIAVKNAEYAENADKAKNAEESDESLSLKCYEIRTLNELNSAVDTHGTCAVNFKADITVASLVIPAWSKGIVSGHGEDATLIAVSHDGPTYTVYRNNGTWSNGRKLEGRLLHPGLGTAYASSTKTINITTPGLYVVFTGAGNTFVIAVPNLAQPAYSLPSDDSEGGIESISYEANSYKLTYNISENIEGPMYIKYCWCIASFES